MGNASRGVAIEDLPASVQRRARALLAKDRNASTGIHQPVPLHGVELGPNSPLRDASGNARAPRRRHEDREHPIQVAIVAWADDLSTLPEYPELKTLYAIPNALGAGGKMTKGKRALEGARRKAEGRRKGMLDLVLPTPRRDRDGRVYGGLYLEIKDEQGTLSQAQRERIRMLRDAGNKCEVAMSDDSAKAIITLYLQLLRP